MPMEGLMSDRFVRNALSGRWELHPFTDEGGLLEN